MIGIPSPEQGADYLTATQLNAQNVGTVAEAPKPTESDGTRELLSSWLIATHNENAAREDYQHAQDVHTLAVKATAAVAARIGLLVGREKRTRYFRTGVRRFAMDTVVEVKFNEYDVARPYIQTVEVEVP